MRSRLILAAVMTLSSTFATVALTPAMAGEVWQGGYQSNSVGVFDEDTLALIDEIPVGQIAEDVDFSTDGTTAFVTTDSGNLVIVIDAETRQVIGNIDIGFVLDAQIERRPDNANLYIGDCSRHELLIIDGDAATAIDLDPATPGVQGIALPAPPWKMDFSPNGQFAYATSCDGGGTILKIDLEQNVFVSSIPVQVNLANSVDVSDDGTLAVVAGVSSGETSIVDLTTDTEVGFHAFGSGRNDGVAIFKARQNAYVLNANFSSGDLNLLELDISDPSNPSLKSVTLLNDPLKPGQFGSQSLRRIGDLLYVSVVRSAGTFDSELVRLDISVTPPVIQTRTSFGNIAFSQVAQRPNNLPLSAIYWTEYATDTVRRVTVDGSVVETLVDTGLFGPQSMAIDPVNSKMYWTDVSPGRIEMANLDGTGRQIFMTGLTEPIGLTVDRVNNKIYWTDAVDFVGGGKIQRANLDGTGVEDVISTGLLIPLGVAVDATGGKLYWTDEGTDNVQRANLDGTNVEVLAISRTPVGIALDRLNSKLYWSEYPLCCTVSAQIVRANLDGTGKEVVYISPRQTNMEQIALDVGIQGKVYWADDFNQTISSVNLDGTGFEDVVTGAGAAWGVAINIVGDSDGDGKLDHLDNAPYDPNPDQSDIDGDGIADVIDPCPSDPTNGCDPAGSAAESIGADGGILATEDGDAEIQFPAGALNDDTSMSITDGGTNFVLATSIGQAEAIFGVDIGPEGTVFNVPITIVFSWIDADDNGQVDDTNLQESKLVITKDGLVISDQCQFDAGCDTVANTFTFSVSSLSEFTLAGPLDTDGDGIADDFAGEVDVCPAEDATGFDVDKNGCIDSFSGLVDLVSGLVSEGVIATQMQNSLLAKVSNAESSASRDSICTAINELNAFKLQVAAQLGKKISAEATESVNDYADSVTAYLEGQLLAGESCL